MADEGVISDESSFYGGDETKQDLEHRVSSSDPSSYWDTHDIQPSVVAYRAKAEASQLSKGQAAHNVYKDYPSGRQLSETVEEFLERLPPYSTHTEACGPWIYISNPTYDPNRDREDLRGFREEGTELLSAFDRKRAEIEDSGQLKSASVLDRKLTPVRKQLEKDIHALAQTKGVNSGKWMLFPSPADVNRIWSMVARATAAGELGHAAKVASNDGSGDSKARLVCAYNEDCGDKQAVKRVLQNLERMGLVKNDRAIYYKADAFTHLEVFSGNKWGLKPSLYASKDVLKNNWAI